MLRKGQQKIKVIIVRSMAVVGRQRLSKPMGSRQLMLGKPTHGLSQQRGSLLEREIRQVRHAGVNAENASWLNKAPTLEPEMLQDSLGLNRVMLSIGGIHRQIQRNRGKEATEFCLQHHSVSC